ncbi:hypothetical protein L195_g014038 [Trifolium pratense]|uniref:Uncharacterized protein n=1 Tax=Trifolium pratense TaxID=57577 RepID=A0A2K3MBE3_TRIPR|nr:hypothetical protein L195_g044207 [Trifolium pratense]PNY17298.1 hypothetical protein L195_g014038 [Trifolium pratense]
MAKAIHLKSWLFKRGQYLQFSNGRVPQLNSNQIFIILLNKKTEDAITRANKGNSTVVTKLEFRGYSGLIGQNRVDCVRIEKVLGVDTSELKEELHWEFAEDFWNEIER